MDGLNLHEIVQLYSIENIYPHHTLKYIVAKYGSAYIYIYLEQARTLAVNHSLMNRCLNISLPRPSMAQSWRGKGWQKKKCSLTLLTLLVSIK